MEKKLIMYKFMRHNYLFLILFFLIIFKDKFYSLITFREEVYTPFRCSILESDYNKLLEFSEIDLIYQSNYINTYIIYKDIYNYMNEVTIRGGHDKEFSHNPVIYDNTLVGVIDKVDKNTSIVKLITNKNSKISVKINDELGVMEYKNDELIVSNISNYSNIAIGDNIYTSNLGNMKENIFIGVVKEINLDDLNIEKIIKVDYKLDIKKINYLTVIKENL